MNTQRTGLLPNARRRSRKGSAPYALLLVYHRIAELDFDPWGLSVTHRHFAQHLEVLQTLGIKTRLQSLVEALRTGAVWQSPAVVITFDDGYADNLYCAKPLLERYAMPATVFIVTGMLGAECEFWWDELERLLLHPQILPERLQLTIADKVFQWGWKPELSAGVTHIPRHRRWVTWQSPPGPQYALYLTLWEQLQACPDSERWRVLEVLRGWVGAKQVGRISHRTLTPAELLRWVDGGLLEVGAHTLTHPRLARLSASAQQEEISHGKAVLEEILDRQVWHFAYPYGGQQDYSPLTTAIVRKTGFVGACANFSGVVEPATDPFQLPRIYVPDVDGEQFQRLLVEWLGPADD